MTETKKTRTRRRRSRKESAVETKTLLVTAHISCWEARKRDRTVDETVVKSHKVSKGVGRYSKRLIDYDAPQYKTVRSAANAVRTYLVDNTLPWSDEGVRILPAAQYLEFVSGMNERMSDMKDAVRDLVKAYPTLKTAAKRNLGDLYNEAEYPLPEELYHKFAVSYSFLPFPAAQDFRVDIGDEELDQVRRDMEENLMETLASATQDLWKRMHRAVSRMAERLEDTDSVFRDSLVINLKELCELLPKLNVADDVELEAMRGEVVSKLTQHAPSRLRDDGKARADVAKQAAKIQKRMEALMR